jgi:hypothetical protein
MAVNDEQPICSSREYLCMGVKVLEPRQGEVIVNPASRRDSNNPIVR